MELARILSKYVGQNKEYTVVDPLFTEKSVGALRVGIFKALNRIPDEVNHFLEGLVNEDERFFESCFLYLPDLIRSFRTKERPQEVR